MRKTAAWSGVLAGLAVSPVYSAVATHAMLIGFNPVFSSESTLKVTTKAIVFTSIRVTELMAGQVSSNVVPEHGDTASIV